MVISSINLFQSSQNKNFPSPQKIVNNIKEPNKYLVNLRYECIFVPYLLEKEN
jgi:hypothetical protein